MNVKVRRKARTRKRKMLRRIAKENWSGSSPMIQPPSIKYELADKQQAITAGGIGTMLQLAKQLEVRKEINQAVPLFKLHLPYDEADHVLNISMNLLAGGSCLEHLEDRRCDEAYLNAVGAERIPDPTTAGDFCRRFSEFDSGYGNSNPMSSSTVRSSKRMVRKWKPLAKRNRASASITKASGVTIRWL